MLPAALFAIPAAARTGLGLLQLIRGGSMRPRRPEYEIPQAAQEELAQSRMGLNARMPGINYAKMRLDQNAASSAYRLNRAATNPNQILSGLSNIQLQGNMASRDLAQAEASDYTRRESNLRRSLGVVAGLQDRAWQLNKYEPYQDAARTKAALVQAGLTNAVGGLDSAASNILGAQLMQGMAPNAYNGLNFNMLGLGAANGGNPAPWLAQGANSGAWQIRAANAMTRALFGF